MASIDLMDAYYSVPIDDKHQKYLKFIWNGTLYKFTCLAQGLSSAPRLFTKILKPVFSQLQEKGHISSGYLDDSFLVGYSTAECQSNVDDTLQSLQELGFLPHDTKSVTIPTQTIHHLGFTLNSLDMTVSISEEKHKKLCTVAITVLNQTMPKIRVVAQMIGMMVSCLPGVEYGGLFYRQLDIEKMAALKINRGDFDKHMNLSAKARADVSWWITNAQMSKKKIDHGKINHVLYTDACNKGWGCTFGQHHNRGSVVCTGRSTSYQLPRAECSTFGAAITLSRNSTQSYKGHD